MDWGKVTYHYPYPRINHYIKAVCWFSLWTNIFSRYLQLNIHLSQGELVSSIRMSQSRLRSTIQCTIHWGPIQLFQYSPIHIFQYIPHISKKLHDFRDGAGDLMVHKKGIEDKVKLVFCQEVWEALTRGHWFLELPGLQPWLKFMIVYLGYLVAVHPFYWPSSLSCFYFLPAAKLDLFTLKTKYGSWYMSLKFQAYPCVLLCLMNEHLTSDQSLAMSYLLTGPDVLQKMDLDLF